jgi:hypothetical protein
MDGPRDCRLALATAVEEGLAGASGRGEAVKRGTLRFTPPAIRVGLAIAAFGVVVLLIATIL